MTGWPGRPPQVALGLLCLLSQGCPVLADASEEAAALVVIDPGPAPPGVTTPPTSLAHARLLELVAQRLLIEDETGATAAGALEAEVEMRGPDVAFLTLRTDLRFSDGTPARLADLESALVALGVEEFVQVTDRTLRLRLAQPIERPALIAALQGIRLTRPTSGQEGEEVLGTGPFRLREVASDRIRLERAGPTSEPRQVRAIEVLYPRTAEQQWSAMSRGAAHIWIDPPADALAHFGADDGSWEIREYPLVRCWSVALNPRRPWLQDPEVRRALDAAVPRAELIDALGPARFEATTGPFLPRSSWTPAGGESRPEGSRASLPAAAGRSALVLGVRASVHRAAPEAVDRLAGAWSELGLEVTLRELDEAQWSRLFDAGEASDLGSLDALVVRWTVRREADALGLLGPGGAPARPGLSTPSGRRRPRLWTCCDSSLLPTLASARS